MDCTRAMPALPELKVLRTVVSPVAIDVMDGLMVLKRTAKDLLHDEAMLRSSSSMDISV